VIFVEVRLGWSGEDTRPRPDGDLSKRPWVKFDITVQEADLARLCREHGIDPGALTPDEAYMLAAVECEKYVIITSGRYTPGQNQAEQLQANRLQFDGVIARIKSAHAVTGS
jgi:hypothetical protein